MAKSDLEDTKRLMGALVRMKPKPHGELKGKTPNRPAKKKTKRGK